MTSHKPADADFFSFISASLASVADRHGRSADAAEHANQPGQLFAR
ncbi:hypothetical protein I553_7127 [Mycobacterium xenopi 4042]|uniref:Uncharacterized protein n=1 Tax=Mycobacterium xenopi 4042 TaxID=1299334 RepID=X7Z3F9_MYCXE|nr:hypothetical protein I553_7127 [Mycobacterium xenopi 4042]EUA33951.1 hypothetical protein I552_4732 [Mycobacterium xenopi 3993]